MGFCTFPRSTECLFADSHFLAIIAKGTGPQPRSFCKYTFGFTPENNKLEFSGRADGQVVRQICVVVLALRRSVSFCSSANWNLTGS